MNEPQTSDRGFKHFDAVPSTYGGGVTVYESSAASSPHIWLRAEENMKAQDSSESTVHLTLESATELRDQLSYLIENHYQLNGESK